MTTATSTVSKATQTASTVHTSIPGYGAPTSAAGHTAKGAVEAIAGEILFVIIASVIASSGPKAANAMLGLLGVMWVLLLINHFGGGTK